MPAAQVSGRDSTTSQEMVNQTTLLTHPMLLNLGVDAQDLVETRTSFSWTSSAQLSLITATLRICWLIKAY